MTKKEPYYYLTNGIAYCLLILGAFGIGTCFRDIFRPKDENIDSLRIIFVCLTRISELALGLLGMYAYGKQSAVKRCIVLSAVIWVLEGIQMAFGVHNAVPVIHYVFTALYFAVFFAYIRKLGVSIMDFFDKTSEKNSVGKRGKEYV